MRQSIGYCFDAAIVLSGMPDRALADLCLRNGLRLVLTNRVEQTPGAFRVLLDDEDVGAAAARALLRVRCARPAIATSASATASLAALRRGFVATLAAERINPIKAVHGPISYETGLALGTDLLTRPERPDGVYCVTGLRAFGIIDATRHRFGHSVPKDLSVVVFDDVSQAGWEAYALTTCAQPVDAIAEACVAWLSLPQTDDVANTEKLSAQLIWRGSVLTLAR